jgi:hypothetical protein
MRRSENDSRKNPLLQQMIILVHKFIILIAFLSHLFLDFAFIHLEKILANHCVSSLALRRRGHIEQALAHFKNEKYNNLSHSLIIKAREVRITSLNFNPLLEFSEIISIVQNYLSEWWLLIFTANS